MDNNMIRCKADEHYFDSAKYAKCPYCSPNECDDTITVAKAVAKPDVKSAYGDDEQTRAYWANKKDLDRSPILGWLVIMDGKGLGQDFGIRKSLSSLGRDEDNDVIIDNLDETISRKRHCLIEYDVKNNTFYIERGENNTYLNEERVGREGRELKGGDMIEIGETKMQFVPFCKDEFSWK